jgi:TfoX/Sxy family transcriptional regulator of competence genes
MAYDEGLAQRVEELFDLEDTIQSKKMFGGVAYLLNGNMAVGISNSSLMVRVDKAEYDDLLKRPHVRVFDLTGRPMAGWVLVDEDGISEDEDLRTWVARGVDFAKTLPAK